MKRITTFVATTLLIGPVMATDNGETQAFLSEQMKLRDSLSAAPKPALDFLQKQNPQLKMPDQTFIDELQQQHQQFKGEEKAVPKALYFVSFSIPEEGLKIMVNEADRLHIPATVRGMVNNDMRQTANAVLRLVTEDKRGGVQIDPMSFRTFGINAVPALVVTCQGKFDRIAGNINLTGALKHIAEKGECAETAQEILKEAADQ
ncbi:type-F conjugative transfer system pilin assembly protein TrbC [Yersinia ruckeri]|uniref:type-F conjugative transfer system pilin assembly protein TrbC n=1 Tax=Yersinia ruckeri TaxID=29486 RepID=UPI000538BF46|nr:type-F conjugative transfer system pilin assembly protein TrbC [Yersinia ruckeri]AUQ43904.1 type-F conjugative transfer system pilin assembly protein TrbC [Yersinia ruckeri]WMS07325.1 type-F conjugative transfer system pilin assembly protein TrbC [Yersinia ruckeri]